MECQRAEWSGKDGRRVMYSVFVLGLIGLASVAKLTYLVIDTQHCDLISNAIHEWKEDTQSCNNNDLYGVTRQAYVDLFAGSAGAHASSCYRM